MDIEEVMTLARRLRSFMAVMSLDAACKQLLMLGAAPEALWLARAGAQILSQDDLTRLPEDRMVGGA